jgi:hypothetical protein
MADKHLTELEWRKFAKGKGLKDTPLVKALATLEHAKTASDRADALSEIGKQSAILLKAGKGDQALVDYLGELDKTVEQRLVSAKAEAKREQARAADSEEEGPAVLTTGLITLLKEVLKGQPMQAMVVTDGKRYGVLLSRRALAPTRSKLLKEYLGLTASKPPILGQCIFEAKAVTFALEGEAAGLAKKLKQALLNQTERRWNVRVRGQSPDDVDEDLDAEEEEKREEEIASTGREAAGTAQEEAAAGTGRGLHPASDERAGEDEERRIRERLSALEVGMKEVREAGGRPAAELGGLLDMLEGQLRRGEFDRSRLVLERIESITAEAQEERDQFRARLKELMTGYAAALREVDAQLSAFEQALKRSGDSELKMIGDAGLKWILGEHGPRIAAAIAVVAKAAPAARAEAADKALQAVGACLDYIDDSDEIAACDGNDLGVDMSIHSTLTHALGELGQLLSEV